jgi:hypothetical protein
LIWRPLLLLALLPWTTCAAPVDNVRAGIEQLATEMHDSLLNRRALFEDLSLQSRCKSLLRSLFPDQLDTFMVFFSRDHQPSAFSLPGGRIYLSAGLFMLIETEDELAFVLAHEAAHVINQHSRRRMTSAPKSRRALEVGDFTTELELEADQVAIGSLLEAGYGLSGIGDFMQRLGYVHGQSSNPHDGTSLTVRIEQLRLMARDERAAGGDSIDVLTAPAKELAMQRSLNLGLWKPVLDCLAGRCAVALPGAAHLRMLVDATRLRDAPVQLGPQADPSQAEPQLANASGRRQWSESATGSTDRVATRWVQIEKSESSLTLSRDGVALQTLRLEIVHGRLGPTVNPDYLAASVRSYRQRFPTEFLHLLAHESVELGAWQGLSFDLGRHDENGLGWRIRVYHLRHSGQQISAVYRAPALYFFERDRVEIEAMIRSIE